MYLTDFNMMLDSKLIDCFSEIALDKDVINKFNFNEIKQTETEKTNDDSNEFYNTSTEIVSSNSRNERKITVRNTCNKPSVKVTTRSTIKK